MQLPARVRGGVFNPGKKNMRFWDSKGKELHPPGNPPPRGGGRLSFQTRAKNICGFTNKTALSIVILIRESMKEEKLERKIAELKAGNSRAFDYIYEQTNRSV